MAGVRYFKVDRYPYEPYVKIFKKGMFEFNPGLTVLVGCNGSGKSTLLKELKKKLDQYGEPVIFFRYDRERLERDSRLMCGDANVNEFFSWVSCSEGEQIMVRLESLAFEIGKFVKNHPGKDIFILIDGVDSGFSIDNIIELKDTLFNVVIRDSEQSKNDIYIICSANSYELAAGEDCIVVYDGRHRVFKSYGAYKNCIMKTRETKAKRYEGKRNRGTEDCSA